jgi:homoserine dehydrogenase
VITAYYLRLQVEDRPGVLADITRIFGEAGISIEAVLQKEPAEGESNVSLIMLTQRVKEKSMNQALAAIGKLDAVTGEPIRIRMESLG